MFDLSKYLDDLILNCRLGFRRTSAVYGIAGKLTAR